MPTQRLSMRQIREVLRLRHQGLTERVIARMIGVSNGVALRRCRRRREQQQLQAIVVHPLGQRPGQPRKPGSPQITMHGGGAAPSPHKSNRVPVGGRLPGSPRRPLGQGRAKPVAGGDLAADGKMASGLRRCCRFSYLRGVSTGDFGLGWLGPGVVLEAAGARCIPVAAGHGRRDAADVGASGVAPISTSMHSAASSIRACR